MIDIDAYGCGQVYGVLGRYELVSKRISCIDGVVKGQRELAVRVRVRLSSFNHCLQFAFIGKRIP